MEQPKIKAQIDKWTKHHQDAIALQKEILAGGNTEELKARLQAKMLEMVNDVDLKALMNFTR